MTAIVSVLNVAVLRCVSIFLLPATWRRRARFREQLRADMQNAPDFLGDIGIDAPEAQAEAMRLRITNPQTRDCIFVGKHDDVPARVTSSSSGADPCERQEFSRSVLSKSLDQHPRCLGATLQKTEVETEK